MRRPGLSGRVLLALGLAAACTACAGQRAATRELDPSDTLVQQAGPAALGGFAALPAGAVRSSDVIVPACVPRSGPPYQLGAVGSFTGGRITLVPGVSVTALSGRFCAVATVVPPPPDRPKAKVCAALTAPKEGLQFDPIQTRLELIPGVSTVVGEVQVVPESFTAFICDDQEPGPIAIGTTISASAAPQLFGTSCEVGPLSAQVTGSITGPLQAAKATLTSPPFPVKEVQASPLCPSGLATNTNEILGLPLAASVTGLDLDVTAALYRAP